MKERWGRRMSRRGRRRRGGEGAGNRQVMNRLSELGEGNIRAGPVKKN